MVRSATCSDSLMSSMGSSYGVKHCKLSFYVVVVIRLPWRGLYIKRLWTRKFWSFESKPRQIYTAINNNNLSHCQYVTEWVTHEGTENERQKLFSDFRYRDFRATTYPSCARFLSFEGDQCVFGLSFSDQVEADNFKDHLQKRQEHEQKSRKCFKHAE